MNARAHARMHTYTHTHTFGQTCTSFTGRYNAMTFNCTPSESHKAKCSPKIMSIYYMKTAFPFFVFITTINKTTSTHTYFHAFSLLSILSTVFFYVLMYIKQRSPIFLKLTNSTYLGSISCTKQILRITLTIPEASCAAPLPRSLGRTKPPTLLCF